MKDRNFDNFDSHVDCYRELHSENIRYTGADSYYFIHHKISLLYDFEKNGKLHFLDLGCGDGMTAKFLKMSFPDFKITGIDISSKSIKKAHQLQLDNSQFLQYDGLRIPFSDQYFERVWVACVFHHIHFLNHSEIAKEIYRVLKPGGRLYFFEHNPWNPITRFFVSTCVFDKNARLLSANYSKKILKEAGFCIRKRKWILFFPRFKWLKRLLNFENKMGRVPLGGQYFIVAEKPIN